MESINLLRSVRVRIITPLLILLVAASPSVCLCKEMRVTQASVEWFKIFAMETDPKDGNIRFPWKLSTCKFFFS
jgi:hypothetical protein